MVNLENILHIMNIEEIRTYALEKAGASEGLKWGEHLCLMVKEKIFMVLSLDEHPVAASFKVNEEDFDALTEQDGISQAPYFAKRQWVKVDDIDMLSEKAWQKRIDEAYLLVAQKLPKKTQKELGLMD